jgi:hypothetical protein
MKFPTYLSKLASVQVSLPPFLTKQLFTAGNKRTVPRVKSKQFEKIITQLEVKRTVPVNLKKIINNHKQ